MAYEVHLEMFEGPLDLLLFLIKKDDLDITNIPIARITGEYLSYLEIMKDLNLETAGDFLVMAATLMAIKARSLLPSQDEEGAASEEEGPDPRAELMARLMEYQKFKEAAKFLEASAEKSKDVFYRGAPRFDDSQKTLNIGIFDLLESLREILDRCPDKSREIAGEEFPIEEKMSKILALIDKNRRATLQEIFADETKRRGILSCFLALLELVKLQKVFIRQDEPFSAVSIYKREEVADVAR